MIRPLLISNLCIAAFFAASAQSYAADGPILLAPGKINKPGQISLTPALTPDGQTAYFPQTDCDRIWDCPQKLYVSQKTETGWSEPQRVDVTGDYRVDWPSVSPDGSKLIFSWTAPQERYAGLDILYDFDIFTLDLTDPEAKPQPILTGDINRPRAGRLKTLRAFHVESAGTLTNAGDLYFWDEREDGLGERDIFVARTNGRGGFERAELVKGPVNSNKRDQLGWINPKGNLMLIASPDRGGLGNDDIFISRLTSEGWSEPQNLGPLVNSEAFDGGAKFTPDGRSIVFTSDRGIDGASTGVLQVWTLPTKSLVEAGILTEDDIRM